MFWTGIVIGLFAGACLGFILSSFFFAKIGSSTEKKLAAATSVEPFERDAMSDQFLLKNLTNEEIPFDKVPN